MKKIVIYARYAMKAVFRTWNGWPHAVTGGILQTCARNIRSGQRLMRPIFWERLRPCEESQHALASYCAQDLLLDASLPRSRTSRRSSRGGSAAV